MTTIARYVLLCVCVSLVGAAAEENGFGDEERSVEIPTDTAKTPVIKSEKGDRRNGSGHIHLQYPAAASPSGMLSSTPADDRKPQARLGGPSPARLGGYAYTKTALPAVSTPDRTAYRVAAVTPSTAIQYEGYYYNAPKENQLRYPTEI